MTHESNVTTLEIPEDKALFLMHFNGVEQLGMTDAGITWLLTATKRVRISLVLFQDTDTYTMVTERFEPTTSQIN